MNSLFSSEKSLVNISNNVFLKDAVSNTDIPDAGIEPGSPALQVDSLPTELSEHHKISG